MTHIKALKTKSLSDGYSATLYYDRKRKIYGVETSEDGVSVNKEEFKSKKQAEKSYSKAKTSENYDTIQPKPQTNNTFKRPIVTSAKSKLRSIS